MAWRLECGYIASLGTVAMHTVLCVTSQKSVFSAECSLRSALIVRGEAFRFTLLAIVTSLDKPLLEALVCPLFVVVVVVVVPSLLTVLLLRQI